MVEISEIVGDKGNDMFHKADLFNKIKDEMVPERAYKGRSTSYVRHVLEPGEEIKLHSHPEEELIIITDGKFRLKVGSNGTEQTHQLKNAFCVFRIPAGQEHYLFAETELDYVVLKNL
jgi:quercetin dioxygenase-like cupin family protein